MLSVNFSWVVCQVVVQFPRVGTANGKIIHVTDYLEFGFSFYIILPYPQLSCCRRYYSVTRYLYCFNIHFLCLLESDGVYWGKLSISGYPSYHQTSSLSKQGNIFLWSGVLQNIRNERHCLYDSYSHFTTIMQCQDKEGTHTQSQQVRSRDA